MADDATPGGLTEAHREYLRAHAIDIELAERLGVRSLTSRADNPQEGVWPNWANHPAILFPWTNEDGVTHYQVRPDNPTNDPRSGKPRKYVFAKDMKPILWAVRPVADPKVVVIIEGTKQGLAGASHAPDGASVYAMAGCRMWQTTSGPIPDLGVADGLPVVVILDADAATNTDVYDAGVGLAQALDMEGATKITFARLPGGADKSGLDDILAGRQPHRRHDFMARLVKGAKPKPADAKPKPKRKTTLPTGGEGETKRATIIINRDRLQVINDLTTALLDRWNQTRLFNHGGVISQLRKDTMIPVDSGTFNDLVQETAMTVTENDGAQGVTYGFSWPDGQTMKATMSRADQFAKLERIAHAPFVRPDGTIVTEPGYDEDTRTLLVPDPVFAGLEVPEEPTAGQIEAARELILTEWLGDFPVDAEADRANLLALMITPAIRGMVPRAPMAVIDGLQMGVGKNLVADSLLTLWTGHPAQPMNWVDEHDELRKQITAAFRTGAEFFVFDEAHALQGAALAQALTAETWQDRILGVSTMANFPNRVTWVALGNNIQVKGDITRRVYRVYLRPRGANPQDRPASSFRHPGQSGLDLLSWTRKHRRELLTAVLTLVRAWYAQGQPHPKKGVSFGSFEAWERMVGGIVGVAGVPDFLGNLKVWRSESDFDTQYWSQHVKWLREQFGDTPFKTAEVKTKALTLGSDLYAAPPRLDDPTEKTYGKALGEAYSRIRGRRYDDLWMERVSSAHGHVSLWQVFSEDDLPKAPEPEPPVTGPNPDEVVCACPPGWTGCACRPMEPDIDLSIDPGPENEHAEARGPAPEDTDGEGHDEVRGPQPVEKPVDDYPINPETDRHVVLDQVVVFDLETGDASDLHKAGPGFVRIGATAIDDADVVAYEPGYGVPVALQVATDLMNAEIVTGHNIMAFDLPALVNENVLTMKEVHQLAADGRVMDTILVARYLDPPMARDKGVDAERKYDLATLGHKFGLGEKLTEVTDGLKKKYGSWDAIPYDRNDPDPERAADATLFRDYMIRDVEVSRNLYRELATQMVGSGVQALRYVRREHRVAAIAAQISANGFLVNQTLLAERITEIEQRKTEAFALLSVKYGVPLHDPKGKEYKSPLASKPGKLALEAALVAAGIPATSLWRTGKSGDLQTSAETMIHYGREYAHIPAVQEIAKAVHRVVSSRSVYETIRNSMAPDGRVHPKIGFEQATGRWSVTQPGLTVLGKRGGRYIERDVLLPDAGEVLVAFDLSQVDMRAVAGLSQDLAYIEMLKAEDPHAELALALFGDRAMRETAKPIGHGWNYGESLRRISEDNGIEPKLVVQFDRMMRERFPRLVEWREEVRALASSGALLDNGWGRMMRPDPHRAHTQGPALMGQGAARDLMMEGLLRLPAEILPMLRAQVHDEIVLSIPADQVDEVSRTVIDALSFEWRGVPILADRSREGVSWGQCYAKG